MIYGFIAIHYHHVVAIIPLECKTKHIRNIIKQGAILYKTYTSKLRSENNVSIIYTHIKNIKKTAVIGYVNIHDIKYIKKIVI